jgi:pyrroline-5-carboxylate reductase
MTDFFHPPSKNLSRMLTLFCYNAPMLLGVIGCGKMGSALIQGAINAKILASHTVFGYDKITAASDSFAAVTGAKICSSLEELANSCDTFLLATKPYDVGSVLTNLASARGDRPGLVISIAAGITLASLESYLPLTMRVIRTMPNTPALVGKGASAFAAGGRATTDDAIAAEQLLSSVGLALQVPEKLLDAVTGLSGSGPAYGFLIIEALADAGVRQGLPRHESIRLAAQTMLGAATMVLETSLHPAQLKDMVTSPGGTTIEGLAALEKNGVRHALIEAVTAATTRSIELSKI